MGLMDGFHMEEIRVITKGKDLLKIGPKAFRDFIAPFVKEKSFLALQKVPTLQQERKWLHMQAKGLDEGEHLFILLFIDGVLAGNCDARKKEGQSMSSNVHFGLAVSKPFRGKGWGKKLLRRGIAEAKKHFKPHRMWLEHDEGNLPARHLYEEVGFVEVARLDEYSNHFGHWQDLVLMQYKPVKKIKSVKR